MSRLLNVVGISVIIIISTFTMFGDTPHGVDPRGKIENIVGEGDFIWDMNEEKFADCVKEARETGRDFNVREIRWTVTGGDQNWCFTRITRMGDYNALTIKREQFRVAILRVDGVWVTRLKYRYREGKHKEGDTDEVKESDKGSKYTACCRISSKQITLAVSRKKQGYIYKISKKDGLMRVNLMTLHDCGTWTMSYKKRADDHRHARIMRIMAGTQGGKWLYMDEKTKPGIYYREWAGDNTGSGWKLEKDATEDIKQEHKQAILR